MAIGKTIWSGHNSSQNVTTFLLFLSRAVKDGTDPIPPLPATVKAVPALEDFLRRCLKLRPGDRPTANALLQHPFIIGGDLAPEAGASASSQKALRDVEGTDDIFSGKSKGKKKVKEGEGRTPTSAGSSAGASSTGIGSQASPRSLEAIADATMNNYTTLDDFSLSLDNSVTSSIELKRGASEGDEERGRTTKVGSRKGRARALKEGQ